MIFFGIPIFFSVCLTSIFLLSCSHHAEGGTTLDLSPWVVVQKEYKSFVARKFAEFRIVPDLIIEAPDELCNVTYPSGAVVKTGEKLSKDLIKEEPVVEWPCEENALYLLYMQNIDDREWDHTDTWAIMNIKGCNFYEGQDIFEYKEQRPDIKLDEYRIVFLIYKQPRYMDYYSLDHNVGSNPIMEIQHFVDYYGLGAPVAGNFFIADDLDLRGRVTEGSPK